jgi:hypothetical protein
VSVLLFAQEAPRPIRLDAEQNHDSVHPKKK